PTILSVTERPAYASQTPRHTSRLQRIPLKNSVTMSGLIFQTAVFNIVSPMRPPFMSRWCENRTRITSPILPTKLPQYTMTQFRSTSFVETLPLAQAITIRLLPVNNSAPPTKTIASPSENTSPPTTRMVAKLNATSLATMV